MLKQLLMLLGILSLSVCVSPVSSDSNIEKRAALQENVHLNGKQIDLVDTIQNDPDKITQGQRQKRFNNYLAYNTDSSSFVSYLPTLQYSADNNNRQDIGANNQQIIHDALLKRLKDIAALTSRQYLPPPTTQQYIPIPNYYLYVPQVKCGCNTQPGADTPTDILPPAPIPNPAPPLPSSPNNNGTELPKNQPPVTDTPPRINTDDDNTNTEDSNNNGFSDSNDYEDGARPISFDPIPPKVPSSVTPPPVEHGSVQAGLEPSPIPEQPPARYPEALPDVKPPNALEDENVQAGQKPISPSPPEVSTSLSHCEKVTLSCCHRLYVTAQCFTNGGCQITGNPCDPTALSVLVNKFREYYRRKG